MKRKRKRKRKRLGTIQRKRRNGSRDADRGRDGLYLSAFWRGGLRDNLDRSTE